MLILPHWTVDLYMNVANSFRCLNICKCACTFIFSVAFSVTHSPMHTHTQYVHLWHTCTYSWILRASYAKELSHATISLFSWCIFLTNWLANSMEQNRAWEPDNYSVGPDIPHMLCTLNVHCRVLKSQPLVPVLVQINLVHKPIFIVSIQILSSHLCQGNLSGVSPSGFSTRTLYVFLFYLMHATYSAHFILIWSP